MLLHFNICVVHDTFDFFQGILHVQVCTHLYIVSGHEKKVNVPNSRLLRGKVFSLYQTMYYYDYYKRGVSIINCIDWFSVFCNFSNLMSLSTKEKWL